MRGIGNEKGRPKIGRRLLLFWVAFTCASPITLRAIPRTLVAEDAFRDRRLFRYFRFDLGDLGRIEFDQRV